ncbi:MAG: hypothetical protein BMS9Abin12_1910 [Acidimicrobiia bacterium]|nr:MAG: hypothetical protein BMS9Abin12_1910 [Acidimicrobiia bacterium]
MVHRRSIEDREVIFGNQGALWGNAMTWFDHETGSVWSQPLGEAILGPAKGTTLELLPSTLTQWGEWKRLHPDTKALDSPGVPTRFALTQMSIVVSFRDDSAAYPLRDLTEVVNDEVDGVPVAIVVEPDRRESWTVFSRTLDDGVIVTLALTDDGNLIDTVSGTTFHISRGTGMEGPLADQMLDQLPAFTSFTKDYFTFYPNGRIWPDG